MPRYKPISHDLPPSPDEWYTLGVRVSRSEREAVEQIALSQSTSISDVIRRSLAVTIAKSRPAGHQSARKKSSKG